MSGETGPIDEVVELPEAMVMAGFFAVSLFNSLQTFIFISRTFEHYRGLYFWSMLVANTAIPFRQIFALLRFFGLAPTVVMTPLVSIGFWAMVTGQSIVLYSRLCLVVGDPRKLQLVAAMIASTFFFVEVPVSALLIASNVPGKDQLAPIFSIFENCQTGLLSLQEAIISGIYIREARKAFKPMQLIKGDKVKKTLRELVGLFFLTAVLDLSLMGLAYSGREFAIMTTYKGVVYSIKLQVEVIVLTNLTNLVRERACTCQITAAENYSSARTRRAKGPQSWSIAKENDGENAIGNPGRTATGDARERHSAELRRIFGSES